MPTKLRKKRNRKQSQYGLSKRLRLEACETSPPVVGGLLGEHKLGRMDSICPCCGSAYFREEADRAKRIFLKCCDEGILTNLHREILFPEPLRSLFESDHPNSERFLLNIRKYNNALALASTCFKELEMTSSGPPTVIVNGELKHFLSPLSRNKETTPCFGELYVMDPEVATAHRLERGGAFDCDRDLLLELDCAIRDINPYAKAYMMMHQVLVEMKSRGEDINAVRMWFVKNTEDNLRFVDGIRVGSRCPPIIHNEVAVVYTGEENFQDYKRELCLYASGSSLQKLSTVKREVDPLCYVLLFPDGSRGYDSDTLNRKGKRVTERRFYLYHLQSRPGQFSAILRARKLTCQYICDCWVRVESGRLEFIRHNQGLIRAELYSGLRDHLARRSMDEGALIGKCVVLPSTFEGSPRHMYQAYHDAMCLVQKFGKADYFITFTCNPLWEDIVNSLLPGQTPMDRPDIVARVFHLKLKAFMELILTGDLFGTVVGYNYVVEFQKRGLPHVHLLLYVAEKFKIRSADDVDRVICAEIPCRFASARLHDIIVSNNIHRCSHGRCLRDDGTCAKNFPKEFCEETSLDTSSFPLYRRRKDRRHMLGDGTVIDNRCVVPYNPFLSLRFNAHINVESCVSINSVKYINMYMSKGGDIATVAISNETGVKTLEYDEISHFVKTRYVGPCESFWRISGFGLSKLSHVVFRLAVHLPGCNIVFFDPLRANVEPPAALERETTLTAWFRLNRENAEARKYLYTDIPLHYVWKSSRWVTRKETRKPILSRMTRASPSDMERFCLRLLLLHCKGAMSFEDLKRSWKDGVICTTFKEAALANGLLCGDEQWEACLEEAVQLCTPRKLRSLFCLICALCSPSNPKHLWEKFKRNLCEDYLSDVTSTSGSAFNSFLFEMNSELRSYRSDLTLDNLGIEERVLLPDTSDAVRQAVMPRTRDTDETVASIRGALNQEQLFAFDAVFETAVSESPDNRRTFFLDGPGGSGKTFVYNSLIKALECRGVPVIASAYTGIASSLLKGGVTIHRAFSIPVDGEAANILSISGHSMEANMIRRAGLIIFDESTMIPLWMIHYIDKLLRDVTQVSSPFGSKVLLFGGDFRQCLPIVQFPSKSRILGQCLQASQYWKQFRRLRLTSNMRVSPGGSDFAKWLLDVGNGITGSPVEIPSRFVVASEDNLISNVFGLSIGPHNSKQLFSRSILAICNKTVQRLNDKIVALFSGKSVSYFSQDTVATHGEDSPYTDINDEVLNSLNPPGLPPHCITLKIGCPIMIIRNINISKGLCNGTRMIVCSLHSNYVVVRHQNGSETFAIPRIPLVAKDKSIPFEIQRIQFPMRLAFCLTVNKSQGQTFERVGIHLERPAFSHGQLYVALSRVRSPEHLSVYTGENDASCHSTTNIVYQEIV